MEENQPLAPRVSVLTVSFNNAPALRRLLSALAQSRQRETMEVVIVDTGSRDESPTLDAEFPETTFLRLPRNFGAAKALNIGVRTAQGEFLMLLDPRVGIRPETIPALVARLEADSSAIAVCPLLVDAQGKPASEFRPLPTPGTLARLWRDNDPGPAQEIDLTADTVAVACPPPFAVLARRLFVKGMNYFDERYGEFGPHIELCFQIRRASRKLLLVPGVTAVLHPDERPPLPAGARAALSADRAHGAAVYIAKRWGWVAGLRFRIVSVFQAFFALLGSVAGGEPSFEFSRLAALLSGQKIDGSQSSI